MKQIMLIMPLVLWASTAVAWELSDVSVLMPLPKTIQDASRLLGAGDSAAKGPLMPAPIQAVLPKLVYNADQTQILNPSLRVLGLRFDPCFFEGTGPVTCRRQIRMVWQPVVSVKNQVTTIDATVHTFYEFDQAEFLALIEEYQALLKSVPSPSKGQPLGVNPRLAAAGLTKGFNQKLRALILKFCGQQNLVRVTVMTLEPGENEWNFMGWDVAGGRILPIQIARINSTKQNLKTKAMPGFELNAVVAPEGYSRSATTVFADSVKAKKALPETESEAFAVEILHTESPARSNPGTVDCAACHMTEPAAQWARLNFAQFNWSDLVARSGFSTTRDVRNVTLGNLQPRRFRAFGYFKNLPLIAQRAINESAIVAEAFEAQFPEAKP